MEGFVCEKEDFKPVEVLVDGDDVVTGMSVSE